MVNIENNLCSSELYEMNINELYAELKAQYDQKFLFQMSEGNI